MRCSHRPIHWPRLGVAFSLLFAGCVQSTPQQEWVYKTFAECKGETGAHNVVIERVTPEGQIYFSAAQTQTDANRVFTCMQSKAQQQRLPPK